MPSDSMEQGGVSTPSHFREDTRLTSEVAIITFSVFNRAALDI